MSIGESAYEEAVFATDPHEVRTVQIKDFKIEIDEADIPKRNAYRVGDPIRVLTKKYNNEYNSYPGIIVGFEDFKELPTLRIAYVVSDYSSVEVKIIGYNAKTADVEVAPINPVDNEIHLDRQRMIDIFDKKILLKEQEIVELRAQKEYFIKRFGLFFRGLKELQPIVDFGA